MPYRSYPLITPDWMPVSEAAARLGCTPQTVLARIRRGDLNVRMVRFDRAHRLHRADFAKALEQLTETARVA